MSQIARRRLVFHPAMVLLVSALAASIFALFVHLAFEGELRRFLLYYFTPIGIPFVGFVFDRAEQYKSASTASWVIDLAVLIPALIRALVPIPLISGHALFLSYSLLTSRSRIARITSLLVLLQVAYIKIFLWRDATLLGGAFAGCLAALVYHWVRLAKRNAQAAA